MKLSVFEGPAGTGKTTALMERLADIVARDSFRDYHRTLALTFMHGSRQRVHARMQAIRSLKNRFLCSTIDSFAWRLIHRWRGLAEEIGTNVGTLALTSYEDTCKTAAALLDRPEVGSWVANSFPVVVVDEMQDITSHRLKIIQSLSQHAETLVAADEFQDLGGSGSNDAVSWLRNVGKVETLDTCFRTDKTGLLDAASALRDSRSITSRAPFKILSAMNANVAASAIAAAFVQNKLDDIAVLSPTGPASSQFSRNCIARLGEKPIRSKWLNKQEVGPFFIDWEAGGKEQKEELIRVLELGDDLEREITIGPGDVPRSIQGGAGLSDWLRSQKSLRGKTTFTVSEICDRIDATIQQTRAYRQLDRGRRISAMTVHQAKNREFKGVVVLWPFQVQKDADKRRRLLYNAVTRAREWATVIVQNSPTNDRLKEPPFVG